MTVLSTKMWKCPRCPMPHNFRPTCDLCGYHNPKAIPDVVIDDQPAALPSTQQEEQK